MQRDVAATLRVSVAAVSRWETGSRWISADLLTRLDAEFGAGGCLVDLVRAIGTPQGFRTGDGTDAVAVPHRYWGHIFDGPPGPVWVWLRPASGSRITAYSYAGGVGLHTDAVRGPDGLFLTAASHDPQWPLHVTLGNPGWVDFGRGTLPEWLRSRTSSPRLQVVRPQLRDRTESAVRQGQGGDTPAAARLDVPDPESQPPATPEERRRLHRRLREARNMSQADAAAAATRLLATSTAKVRAESAPVRPVTRIQILDYEAGRTSRVRYLPALLDMAYGAFGWSCYEMVPVRRLDRGLFEARFPEFWTGPVCITLTSRAPTPAPGQVSFAGRRWKLDRQLAAGSSSFFFCRVSGDHPLRVQAPPGWRVAAHMGRDPDAQDASAGWVPASALGARDSQAGSLGSLTRNRNVLEIPL
jgi:transcriptional regulator with XRE-family HTH domain